MPEGDRLDHDPDGGQTDRQRAPAVDLLAEQHGAGRHVHRPVAGRADIAGPAALKRLIGADFVTEIAFLSVF